MHPWRNTKDMCYKSSGFFLPSMKKATQTAVHWNKHERAQKKSNLFLFFYCTCSQAIYTCCFVLRCQEQKHLGNSCHSSGAYSEHCYYSFSFNLYLKPSTEIQTIPKQMKKKSTYNIIKVGLPKYNAIYSELMDKET